MQLEVALVRDEEAFRRLEPEWNVLLRASASDCIFLTWEWVSTWWGVYGGVFRPHVLVARDEHGTLHGIAPLMVGPGTDALGRRLRYLRMIGQGGDTVAEYLDFIVRRGHEGQVTARLAAELARDRRHHWDIGVFTIMLAGSPNVPIIERELRAAGLDVERHSRGVAPYLTLPEDWTALVNEKGKHFRLQWNNFRNRLGRQGEVAYRLAGRDVAVDEAMAEVEHLNRARFAERGKSFRSDRYRAFHQRLGHLFLKRGWLVLMLMTLDGLVVAARYDFAYADKLWSFQGGWRPEHEKLRVAHLLTGKVIEHGMERGCREYDFLGGAYEYKLRWSNDARELIDLTIYARDIRVRAYRAYRRARSWLGRTLRRPARNHTRAEASPGGGAPERTAARPHQSRNAPLGEPGLFP